MMMKKKKGAMWPVRAPASVRLLTFLWRVCLMCNAGDECGLRVVNVIRGLEILEIKVGWWLKNDRVLCGDFQAGKGGRDVSFYSRAAF